MNKYRGAKDLSLFNSYNKAFYGRLKGKAKVIEPLWR